MKPKEDSKNVTLYCFSPAVMLVTFLTEFALALYTFLRSRKANSNLGIVLGLVFLGTFQLAEYMICRGSDALLWSRIGLFCITFLPVFGYYLIAKIKNDYHFVKFGFLLASGLAFFLTFYPSNINGAACAGNYVILNVQPAVYSFFGYYYFGFLLLGIWKAVEGIRENPEKKNTRKALTWLIIGYLSFILPLTLVYIFLAGTRAGVTSIMCGFAIVFAFILTFKIAPIYHSHVKTKKYLRSLKKMAKEIEQAAFSKK